MKILVTGGMGYIGSHTVVELIKAGYETVILDNLCNSSIDVLKKIENITGVLPAFFKGDILDREFLDRVFAENSFDGVIHFAGLKAVGESVSLPLTYFQNNVTGSLNLLEAMKAAQVHKVVFSSSASVYGETQEVPMNEATPKAPTNPYSLSKSMVEDIMLHNAVSDSAFGASLLRYFNPVGAHESGLLGENPKGIPNNLMPFILKVATGELPKLMVFGKDYDTVDGTGVRDYIHVVDLAKGHVKALERLLTQTGAEVFNLGTGKGTSVLELVKAFELATGKSVGYEITARRPGDVTASYADTSKAFEILGWKAELDLETMCKSGWNFVKCVY